MEQRINKNPKIDRFHEDNQVNDYVWSARMCTCIWEELKIMYPNEDTTGRYEKITSRIIDARKPEFLRLKGQFKKLEPQQFLMSMC